MAMAYQINFWYHFSKGLVPLEVVYARAKIQQSCADVDIVEKIFRKLLGSFPELSFDQGSNHFFSLWVLFFYDLYGNLKTCETLWGLTKTWRNLRI